MAYPTITAARAFLATDATTATSTSITIPATTVATHTQVLLIGVREKTSTITFSTTGWTLVGTINSTDSQGRMVVYKRVGVYASAATTVTFSIATKGIIHALAVTGPLDAFAFNQNAFASTATAPSVTAVGAETVWVQGVATSGSPRNLAAPADTTALTALTGTVAHGYIIGFALATKNVAGGATGASGNWTLIDTESTTAVGDGWESVSLAFSASTGGGGGGTTITISGGGELPVTGGSTGGSTGGGNSGGSTGGGGNVNSGTGSNDSVVVVNTFYPAQAAAATAAQSAPKLPDIPALPADLSTGMRRFLEPLREYIQVIAGRRGDDLDTAVTFRDLVASGVAQIDLSNVSRSGAPPISLPLPEELLDFATPPPPTNLSATSGVGSVILQWEGTGFRSYDFTEIWRSDTDNLSAAFKVGTSKSQQFSDNRANNTGVAYYWVRFVSRAAVIGPFNATSGLSGTATQDPAYLISVLSEQYGAAAVADAPFFYVATTTTINGVSVPQGTYIKSAYIANATIGSAQIRDLSANKITAGYASATIGFNGAKLYGTELYSGGSVTTQTDAQGNIVGFTPVAPTFKVSDTGVAVRADVFSVTNGGTGTMVPFYVTGNVAYIDGANINNYIQSRNYAAGSLGFNINAVTGSAEFNNAFIRGKVETVVTGGNVQLGKDVGPALTNPGHHGLSLSHTDFNDIFIRRADGVKFFRVNSFPGSTNFIDYSSADGLAIETPKLKVYKDGSAVFAGSLSAATGTFSGTLTASAVNAVNTINIQNEAVTVASGENFTGAPSLTRTTSGGKVLILASLSFTYGGSGSGSPRALLYRNGVFVTSFDSTAVTFVDTPGAGSNTWSFGVTTVNVTAGDVTATWSFSNSTLTLTELKR